MLIHVVYDTIYLEFIQVSLVTCFVGTAVSLVRCFLISPIKESGRVDLQGPVLASDHLPIVATPDVGRSRFGRVLQWMSQFA